MATRFLAGWVAITAIMAAACLLTLEGCSSHDRPVGAFRSAVAFDDSAEARLLVDAIRSRFLARYPDPANRTGLPWPGEYLPILRPSEADTVDVTPGSVTVRFPPTTTRGVSHAAEVTLPASLSGAIRLRDADSGAAIEVSLIGATDAAAEPAYGYVVYRRGFGGIADVVHRVTPTGTEDHVLFELPPPAAEARYAVGLTAGIAGLRLVSHTLELLDAAGTPRFHVGRPFIMGSDGVRHDAAVALEGCAYDTSPRPPWGRAVTPPGASRCTLVVSWAGAPVVYPALLDPTWETTGNMMYSRFQHTGTTLADNRVLVVGGRARRGMRRC